MQPATGGPDDPVSGRRRAVALAGHLGDIPRARQALEDESSSVRSTGLGALDRLDALHDEEVTAALSDPSPAVRRRAAELAARRPGVEIGLLLEDDDPGVVEMTAWALGERRDPTATAALADLARVHGGHEDPLCREAAVAALGAIGDPAGLPAVIAALDDKPAVRRRAAVSLAAFSGAEADQALRRCLADRDWQVRQVAEDLLDDG
ncbi:MAG: HEAT repeat domain-containing protein [Acidimicrobiales bacterium]|nr:HEAT repeat domain-containing protein [Acidimicrobiales bacterium]